MAAPTFNNIEKRAGMLSFLKRQFFVKPTLPDNVNLERAGRRSSPDPIPASASNARASSREAKKHLVGGRPDDVIEVWKLDLQSYDSITAFVERTATIECLDIVVLNAGVSKQFFERDPAKNVPNHPGRLVIVSSDVASWARFKERKSTPLLAALDKQEKFGLDRYPTSKLLGQLFVTEVVKRVPVTFAVITLPNLGWCYDTDLGHVPGGTWVERIVSVPKRIIGRRSEIGAHSVTDAAVRHGPEAYGRYCEDCKLQPKAPMVYQLEGEQVAKVLCREVMAELSFAKVEDIIQRVEK